MSKKIVLLSFALTCLAAGAAGTLEDTTTSVRAGCTQNGRPFWNGHATFFRFAPAFDFKPVDNAWRYRFTLKKTDAADDAKNLPTFRARSPEAELSPVWEGLANTQWTVVCEGVDAEGKVLGKAGERTFVKTAPFKGGYAPAARPYRESARMIYEYMTSLPAMRTLVEKGVPDQDYQHNAYPSKTHAAHIAAMLKWAEFDPNNRKKAMRFARASGDYLLSQLEPSNAPLAFWPPTYGRKPLEFDPKTSGGKNRKAMVGNDPEGAAKYRGQVMTLYPADVGTQFIALSKATGDRKYLEAAKGIGETYLKIRRADGTWALKYWLATGEVQCPNPLVPTKPMVLFERLADATGDAKWRKAADECFAWLEKGPLTDWNWDGQFEDIEPRPPYMDLTKHNAIEAMFHLLKRRGDDPAARKLARELLRWSEDQFVFWEAPCAPDVKVPCAGSGKPFAPGKWHYPSVFEQYSCYIAIDASASKMIAAYLAMYRAERDPLYLEKAKSLADSITRIQEPSGRVPTFWEAKDHWISDVRYDWLNCMASSAAALLDVAEACGKGGNPMKFLSFNIWGDYFKNPVEERESAIESAIRQYAPDVIAFQEVTPAWWDSKMFKNLSTEYGIVRGDEEDALMRAGAKGARQSRWMNHEPLFYRKDRLVLLDSGLDFFHLSLGAEKSVTWAVLEDRTDKRRFIAFATHFWWQYKSSESDALREYNALQIMWRIAEIRRKWGELPVIGGGDLNAKPGSLAHDVFRRNGFLNAADMADVRSPYCSIHTGPDRGEDGKYHGKLYKPESNVPMHSIDHVLYTAGIHALKHELGMDQATLDASDHSPVMVEFELTNK